MKKVFSLKAFIDSMSSNGEDFKIALSSLKSGWPQKCEGLTEREIIESGYHPFQDWMVEVVEDEKSL
jgi:hypothetical protein